MRFEIRAHENTLEKVMRTLEQRESAQWLDALIKWNVRTMLDFENYRWAEQLLEQAKGRMDGPIRAGVVEAMLTIRSKYGPGFNDVYQAFKESLIEQQHEF